MYMCTCVYVCMCIYAYVCLCVYVCLFVCVCVTVSGNVLALYLCLFIAPHIISDVTLIFLICLHGGLTCMLHLKCSNGDSNSNMFLEGVSGPLTKAATANVYILLHEPYANES